MRKFKLIEILLAPDIANDFMDFRNSQKVLEIYSACAKEIILEGLYQEYSEIKIYARDSAMLGTLKALDETLKIKPIDGFLHRLEPRWLTIIKKC
jgi:hypothetical protein